MRAEITCLPDDLDDEVQKVVGREWLIVMHQLGIKVNGVCIKFRKDAENVSAATELDSTTRA